MKTIRISCRIIVGALFIFTGFLKGIDPLGSTYKFIDYFEVFQIDFLSFAALPLAIGLNLLEMVIGFCLLFGIRMKLTSWILLFTMSFFTLLTLYIAIFNPVTDCGCFGDAFIVSNWQTFFKDIFLFGLTIIIFFNRKKYEPAYKCTYEWMMVSFFVLAGLFISIAAYRNLPFIDFSPYKIGTDISEKMSIPESAPKDEFVYSFIYEKQGIQKEYSIDNLPDSSWAWVETKQELIKEGYVPPIHDFTITTLNGEDITRMVLKSINYTYLIIAYDLKKGNLNAFRKINEFIKNNDSLNVNFLCLTSSTYEDIDEFTKKVHPEFNIFLTDEITLKTIIRSNPGLVLLRGGIILGKWHYNNIPEANISNPLAFSLDYLRISSNKLVVTSIISLFFLVSLLLHLNLKKSLKK